MDRKPHGPKGPVRNTPPRKPPRLEGEVQNRGIKKKRKTRKWGK